MKLTRYKIVSYQDINLGSRYISSKYGIIYDTYKNNKAIKYHIPSHGYYSCYLEDVYGKKHDLLVHRIIANTWICDVTNNDVHHKNHNRLDPSMMNLEVLTINEHRKSHNKGSNNNTAKLSESNVIDICEMLVDNYTHREISKIMSDKLNKKISVDSIDKIACGKNWQYISKNYNIKKSNRETMNEFSSRSDVIAKMKVDDKMSNKEIAIKLGISTEGKQFIRFIACASRYAKKYRIDKHNSSIT